MRYSTRRLLEAAFVVALLFAAWSATGEIWVYWYGGLLGWHSEHGSELAFLLLVLSLGFAAGVHGRLPFHSRTDTLRIFYPAVAIALNLAMYQVTSAAMSQVHYAEIELGAHITGALQALASATRSGLILAFTALAVTAITVAGSFRDGKYLNGLVAISAAYWLIVLALGFGNSAASLANPD